MAEEGRGAAQTIGAACGKALRWEETREVRGTGRPLAGRKPELSDSKGN